MFVPLLATLSIASVAYFLGITAREEIVRVAAACTASICLFLSLVFAPVLVKMIVVAALVMMKDRFLESGQEY